MEELFLLNLQLTEFFHHFQQNLVLLETKLGIKISIIKTKNNKPKNNKLKISLANLFDSIFFY